MNDTLPEEPGTTRIPPDPKRLIHALRSIGYSLEGSVADLIDNSIDAGARHVLIRVYRTRDRIEEILVVDDGCGMSEGQLDAAMQFGSNTEGFYSLGKFGLGLKIASLSQCLRLDVLTRREAKTSGRAWTVQGIEQDWQCERLASELAEAQLQRLRSTPIGSDHGTAVVWSQIDRIALRKGGIEPTIAAILSRLRTHLGLHFHRFLEDGRIAVKIDCQRVGGDEAAIAIEVEPLNPFQYKDSGDPYYPTTFDLDLSPTGQLCVEAHIWPPKSDSKNYKLDGRAAARQGFYFYRNDRLIQAGGWNDSRQPAEPHLSLARAAINLPSTFDSYFALDVQKSSLKLPPAFFSILDAASDKSGTTFEDYLRAAQKVYRQHKGHDPRNFPLVPGAGFPASLRTKLKDLLAGPHRVREVNFEWADLEGDGFFEIDRESRTIRLNKRLRGRVLDGRRASATDAPLFKTLLFLLLRDNMDSGRVSKGQKEWLEQCSSILMQAARALKEDE